MTKGAFSSKQPVPALEDSGSFPQGSCCPPLPSARSPAASVLSQTCDRGYVAHFNKSLGAERAEPQLDFFSFLSLPKPAGLGAATLCSLQGLE